MSLTTFRWDLSSGAELTFRFGLTTPGFPVPKTGVAIQQTVSALVEIEEPRPIEYFSDLARKLCDFITLALDQPVSIQSMTGYLDLDTFQGENHHTQVKVYGQFAPRPERKPTISWDDALFLYPQVGPRLSDMLAKWFESYESFEPAFNLYFASRTHPSLFLDTKILWLTQALEAYHRRSSDETAMSARAFANLRETLMQSCPKRHREMLNNRLRYGNELSFKERIERLLEPFERWFGGLSKRKALAAKVRDTRNYYTHYDETTTKRRATGPHELVELYEKLDALFQLHLLRLVGLEDSSIASIVERNSVLQRKLGI